MSIYEEVEMLLRQVPRAPEQPVPSGATTEEIKNFEIWWSTGISEDLKKWLALCNGAPIGPGGLYGIPPSAHSLLIKTHLQQHESWIDKGWLPLAGDGCGNYFILDTTTTVEGKNPILFIDHEEGYDAISYIVASNLWDFFRFLLRKEIGNSYWPFNEGAVLSDDPEIINFSLIFPLPWQ